LAGLDFAAAIDYEEFEAGETGLAVQGRRRRSNRPGISQAKEPLPKIDL